jgi:hypothetical protein
MTGRAATILVILLVLLSVGGYFFLRGDAGPSLPSTNNSATNTPATNTPVTNTPNTPNTSNPLIRVTAPVSNAIVGSPVTVSGEARGNWYFEASFPIRVLDANGRELGVGVAQAQGDWMTTDFVPFSVKVNFSTPTTPTGTIVLEKDNPSGLPEHDAQVRVPVRFATVSQAQTRVIKVYFYDQKKDKDASGNILCSAQGLVAVDRTIPLTNTPIQDAVKELLKGPTAAERTQLPGTEFPLPGVTLASASLNTGSSISLLTLTFNDPQNKTSGGSCRVSVLRAQIEATAKQFGGVNSVRFSPSSVFQP